MRNLNKRIEELERGDAVDQKRLESYRSLLGNPQLQWQSWMGLSYEERLRQWHIASGRPDPMPGVRLNVGRRNS